MRVTFNAHLDQPRFRLVLIDLLRSLLRDVALRGDAGDRHTLVDSEFSMYLPELCVPRLKHKHSVERKLDALLWLDLGVEVQAQHTVANSKEQPRPYRSQRGH